MSAMWWVYIIETRAGRLYTGVTTDVARRFREHVQMADCGRGRGAKFFRSDPPLRVVYREQAPSRAGAQQREAAIKQCSRADKLALIAAAGEQPAALAALH